MYPVSAAIVGTRAARQDRSESKRFVPDGAVCHRTMRAGDISNWLAEPGEGESAAWRQPAPKDGKHGGVIDGDVIGGDGGSGLRSVNMRLDEKRMRRRQIGATWHGNVNQ